MNKKAICQKDSDCLNAYANNWNGNLYYLNYKNTRQNLIALVPLKKVFQLESV